MGAALLLLFVLVIVGLGVLAIVSVFASHKEVKARPETLARAAAPLGLQPVPDPLAMATWAFQGTILRDMPQVAAVVQGQTAMGHVTLVETSFTSGGRIRQVRVQTVVVFYAASRLPRLVIQPRSDEWAVEGLQEIDFSEEDDESLAAFGYTYAVHAEDVAAVRRLMTPGLAAMFDRLDDEGKAPVVEVLPDRVLFFMPKKAADPDTLGPFLNEAFGCVQAMVSAAPR